MINANTPPIRSLLQGQKFYDSGSREDRRKKGGGGFLFIFVVVFFILIRSKYSSNKDGFTVYIENLIRCRDSEKLLIVFESQVKHLVKCKFVRVVGTV